VFVAVATTFSSATETTPSADPEEIMQASAAFYAEGRLDRATAVLRDGVETYPADAQLHFMLANAFFRQQDWPGAVRHFEQASRLRPAHPDTYLWLGHAHFSSGQIEAAVKAWQTAVRQSPHDALPSLSLAMGLHRNGDATASRRRMRQAMALDENWRERISNDVRWTTAMVEALIGLADEVAISRTAAAPAR
jgi:Flp pilus assembly protein TadD